MVEARSLAGRARCDPVRGTGRAGEGSGASRRHREAQLAHAIGEEFSCLTQAQTRLPHFGGFAAVIGAMSAASLAEPSWRVKHFAHEDKGLRPGWAGGGVMRCGTMPRIRDMG